ncbi:MAG: hypothetical protein KF689_11450 [Gemmatimonadaceae bacterium]|nr:hypothetical protein [Gemmatimonadaceae bacterium]MCW5825788.1 hypothetical protein [Gemmatimonadaceae bacterium]
MTVAFPAVLAAAGAAAFVTVLLHLIVTDKPPSDWLPTSRFIPPQVQRAAAIRVRPADLWLLLLRILALLAAGVGLSRVRPEWSRQPIATIVAVDMSPTARLTPGFADSATAWAQRADVLLLVDDAVTPGRSAQLGSLLRAPASARPVVQARLGAVLVAMRREASRLRARADSIELVLVSPLFVEDFDAGTAALRAGWPGRIRLVRTAVSAGTAPGPMAELRWLDSLAAQDPWREGWVTVEPPDTVGALIDRQRAAVAPFERRWQYRGAEGRSIVSWLDGEPAAVQFDSDSGCVRVLGFAASARGDIADRPAMTDLRNRLSGPCRGLPWTLVRDSIAERFGSGDGVQAAGAVASALIPGAQPRASQWDAFLVLLALALLFAERRWRRYDPEPTPGGLPRGLRDGARPPEGGVSP